MTDEQKASERERFEASGMPMWMPKTRAAEGYYTMPDAESRWQAWLARAKQPISLGYVCGKHIGPRSTCPACELEAWKRAAPLCDEHAPIGTCARSGCPYCEMNRLYNALSRIDYALAVFIANARTDVPALCETARRAIELLQRWHDQDVSSEDYEQMIADFLAQVTKEP